MGEQSKVSACTSSCSVQAKSDCMQHASAEGLSAARLTLQALVRERMNDWGKGLCARLGKKMVELTGDYTPDLRALLSADIIICTPEKWDGISRNWQNRTYVQKVCLLVIDEIHLLGADRSGTND